MPSDMQADYRIRPITALQYRRMGELGLISGDERVELLDGELIAMPPIGPDHAFSVRELTEIFYRLYGGRAKIDVRNPLALDAYSEPEPDLMLLVPHRHRYRDAIPAPSDLLLVVEVANSSWRYDRFRKLRAYARCGIVEVWIVNIAEACVLRFRDPSGDVYREETRFDRGSKLAPAVFPDDAFEIDAILP